jgi:hypothetical protein
LTGNAADSSPALCFGIFTVETEPVNVAAIHIRFEAHEVFVMTARWPRCVEC